MEAKDMNRTECLHLERVQLKFFVRSFYSLLVETVSLNPGCPGIQWLRLASNSRTYVSASSAVVTDVSHHAWQNTCLI